MCPHRHLIGGVPKPECPTSQPAAAAPLCLGASHPGPALSGAPHQSAHSSIPAPTLVPLSIPSEPTVLCLPFLLVQFLKVSSIVKSGGWEANQ